MWKLRGEKQLNPPRERKREREREGFFLFFSTRTNDASCIMNDLCCRVFERRTVTTETPTGRRRVASVTWPSPLPWWPSRTTRAKSTPRTWGWKPLAPKLQVCTLKTRVALLTSHFLFPFNPAVLVLLSHPLHCEHWTGCILEDAYCFHRAPPPAAVASQTPAAAAPSKKKPVDDSSAVAAAVAAAAAAGGAGENNDNPDRFCGICQASFNNPLMAQQHYVGKKHRKQTTKQKLMETYGPSTAPGQTSPPPAGQSSITSLWSPRGQWRSALAPLLCPQPPH